MTHNEYISSFLEKIIKNIQENGYKVTSVSEIINDADYEDDNNMEQTNNVNNNL